MRRGIATPRLRRFLLGIALVITGYAALSGWHRFVDRGTAVPELVLLLPDSADERSPLVQVWVDAARETGAVLRIERASHFLRPLLPRRRPVAIVMPDSVHRRASSALINRLEHYVLSGGSLMLVFDAATLTPDGTFPRTRSRFSSLVGVDYGLYDRLRGQATVRNPIEGPSSTFLALDIPPGKAVVSKRGETLSTYSYGQVSYAHFVTRGTFDGNVLLRGARQGSLVAGVRSAGKGKVLFVNLPLGYLRSRSDGALLHGFLSYFNTDVARLPRLLPTPGGTGGMVLNWHVDSNASYAALEAIDRNTRLIDDGPFSIHLTAGPDTYVPGDKAGFNLVHDPRAMHWVRRFRGAGHAIGSHGGWIHNVFGTQVNEHNAARFSRYLDLNFMAVERATGSRVIEYSAPNGNQPQWVTNWLDAHGVNAYYFTGDTGMGPTHTYRDGRRSDRHTWAFPITPYGRNGSFEEAMHAGVPTAEVRTWLRGLIDFTARRHTVRLIYFHPPGALLYLQPMQDMILHARAMSPARFRWYTMGDYARFLSRRESVRWTLAGDRAADRLDASSSTGLEGMTWLVPISRYGRPVPVQGIAIVKREAGDWLVTASAGRTLRVNLPRLSPPTMP